MSSTSTSSPNFDTIFTAALREYKKQTKKDITSHPLADQLKSCDSSNAILTVLQSQVRAFDQSQSADERWTKWLDPTVNVLYAFSGFLNTVAGSVSFPDIKLPDALMTFVATDISTLDCDFYWDWNPTPSEQLPWLGRLCCGDQ